MNNSFFSKFGPKEPKFFPMLEGLSQVILSAAELLEQSMNYGDPDKRHEFALKIKDIEREGDKRTNHIFDELSKSFITPFDREDIHDLASSMDDTIDLINSDAKRISMYNPKPIGTSGLELSALIVQDAKQICKAMGELEKFRKSPDALLSCCSALHDIENRADDVYEHFVINLFQEETDSIELMKIKEIMQEMEKTTDAAERVGKVLRSMIVKYA